MEFIVWYLTAVICLIAGFVMGHKLGFVRGRAFEVAKRLVEELLEAEG